MEKPSVAIITPTYKEPRAWISQAVDSVRQQITPCTHFLVADGVVRDDIDFDGVISLRAPKQSNDGGATPRAIGGRAAIEAGFDVIAYLDADDMLEPNFVTEILRAFDAGFDCVGVPAQRVTTANEPLFLTDGSPAVTWVPHRDHLGQGELCFLRACGLAVTGPSLALNEVWGRMPRSLGGTCDLFWSWAAFDSPAKICWTLRPSYRYRMTNADVYPTYGLTPPPDANPLKSELHHQHHDAWNSLDREKKAEILNQIGITRGYRVRYPDCVEAIRHHVYSASLLTLDTRRTFAIHPRRNGPSPTSAEDNTETPISSISS